MEETPQGKIIASINTENTEIKKRLFDARQSVMELGQELHDWIDKVSK